MMVGPRENILLSAKRDVKHHISFFLKYTFQYKVHLSLNWAIHVDWMQKKSQIRLPAGATKQLSSKSKLYLVDENDTPFYDFPNNFRSADFINDLGRFSKAINYNQLLIFKINVKVKTSSHITQNKTLRKMIRRKLIMSLFLNVLSHQYVVYLYCLFTFIVFSYTIRG